MSKKWVYFFGGKETDGQEKDKNLVGGKGANLAEMVSLGIPVPPGFTITTEACTSFYSSGEKWPEGLEDEVKSTIKRVEAVTGSEFGSNENPLLLSVRSGARVSMPGMMDTVLNLGLNDVTVQALIKKTNNPRFALDSYRRFIQMYGDVVMGVEHDLFEAELEAVKQARGVDLDTELDTEALQ